MLKVETSQQTLINKKGETLEIYKIEGTEDTFAIVKVCLPNKGI